MSQIWTVLTGAFLIYHIIKALVISTREHMKFGRPSKFKKKYNQIAFDLLTKGYSKEAVAGQIGISKQCFYEWVQKYQDFGDAVQRGASASQFFWEDLGMRGTLGQIKGFNASSWMFNMKNRFGWAEKSDQNISGQHIQFYEISYADAMEYIKGKRENSSKVAT